MSCGMPPQQPRLFSVPRRRAVRRVTARRSRRRLGVTSAILTATGSLLSGTFGAGAFWAMAALCALPFQLIPGLRQDDAPSERPAPGIARCVRWLPGAHPARMETPSTLNASEESFEIARKLLKKPPRPFTRRLFTPRRANPSDARTDALWQCRRTLRSRRSESEPTSFGSATIDRMAWRCSYGWRQSVKFVPRCGLIHFQMGRRPTPTAVPRSGDDTAARLARGMEVGHRDPRTQFPPNLRCRYGHSSRCDVSGPRR